MDAYNAAILSSKSTKIDIFLASKSVQMSFTSLSRAISVLHLALKQDWNENWSQYNLRVESKQVFQKYIQLEIGPKLFMLLA